MGIITLKSKEDERFVDMNVIVASAHGQGSYDSTPTDRIVLVIVEKVETIKEGGFGMHIAGSGNSIIVGIAGVVSVGVGGSTVGGGRLNIGGFGAVYFLLRGWGRLRASSQDGIHLS